MLHSVLRNRPLSVQKTSFLGDKQVACPDKAGEAVTGRVRRPQGDLGNLGCWLPGCLVRFLFWRPQRAAFLHLVRLHGWDSQIENTIRFQHVKQTILPRYIARISRPVGLYGQNLLEAWKPPKVGFGVFWKKIYRLLHALMYFGRTPSLMTIF